MVGLILTLLLCATPAYSQETPPLAETGTEEFSASDALEAAKSQYFAGGHALALDRLTELVDRLDNDPDADLTILVQAEVYRAEIQYVTEDRAASWASFVRVLERMPDFQINTFLHPQEVVDWFELVRRETSSGANNIEPAVIPTQQAPVWVYAPVGIPQFGQGDTGAGVVFASSQLATAAASIGLHLHMRGWRRRIASDGTARDFQRFNQVRYGVQLPVTVAFYALYATSILTGRRQFARNQPVETTLWLDVEQQQIGLALRF